MPLPTKGDLDRLAAERSRADQFERWWCEDQIRFRQLIEAAGRVTYYDYSNCDEEVQQDIQALRRLVDANVRG